MSERNILSIVHSLIMLPIRYQWFLKVCFTLKISAINGNIADILTLHLICLQENDELFLFLIAETSAKCIQNSFEAVFYAIIAKITKTQNSYKEFLHLIFFMLHLSEL